MKATTIKIFLVHGNPSGLRTAELSNWSGKAIAAPRTEVSDLIKRSELTSPGIYFLTGVHPESGDNSIYVGESENVTKRLKGHADKDFWNAITVFVSKDDNLTKAHIRHLEGKFIERAIENSESGLMNGGSSGSPLPESDAAEMEIFFNQCLQLLPVLGINNFHKTEEPESSREELLYCKIKGLTAKGKRTANGFVVFKGSQAVLEHRPSANKRMCDKRERLIEKGFLLPNDKALVFTKDIEFGSPSTAGGIIRGGETNGLTSWKNYKGIKLKDIEVNNQNSDD